MILYLTFSVFLLLFLIYGSIELIGEKEWMAVFKIISILTAFSFSVFLLTQLNNKIVFIVFDSLAVLCSLILFFPLKNKRKELSINQNIRYDERDTMFSRNELIKGTKKYLNYYKNNPEKEVADNNFRKLPGLLSSKSLFYNAKAFKAAQMSFELVKLLHNSINSKENSKQVGIPKQETSDFLKLWAKHLGALDVGITQLKPYHYYSTKGRGQEYGNKIEEHHRFAIAFTVEMDHEMVKAAPQASIVMESANQYLNSGTIAIMLAGYLKEMGYSARAHIDGNYQVICPLIASDASLGEIGRMGLLMTRNHGPRVRIGVVTTDFELEVNKAEPDSSVESFCLTCKKCATCCPSQSIPYGKPKENDGSLRWKIDSESCFTYWCKAGTDCGRCMAICPYSHPNTTFHGIIRWGIRNNVVFRKLAIHLDDFFYGRKPKPKKLPKYLVE